MTKLNTIIADIIRGFSTFSLVSTSNHSVYFSPEANRITMNSWEKTGENLRNAINKVGEMIGLN